MVSSMTNDEIEPSYQDFKTSREKKLYSKPY